MTRLQAARIAMRDVVDHRVDELVEAILDDDSIREKGDMEGWSQVEELFEKAVLAHKIVLLLEDVDPTDYAVPAETTSNPWNTEIIA